MKRKIGLILLLCCFVLGLIPVTRIYAEETVTAVVETPEKPTATNVVNGVRVKWNAVEGVTKYGVWRSETGKNGTYKWLGNPTSTSYLDTNVESGKTYHYKITSMIPGTNTHGEKSVAGGVIFVNTPDFTQRYNKAAGITLEWNEIDGATGYGIYRKSFDGTDAWVRVGTVNGSDTLKWTDTSVQSNNGTVYRYTVRALAGSDLKTLSGCRSVGRTMVRLTSRTLSSATATASDSVKCTWTTTVQASGYEIRFMEGSNVYKTFVVGNYKTGVKTFTGLEPETTYRVQVRSYKKVENVGSFYSAWSEAQSVTTPAEPKPTVTPGTSEEIKESYFDYYENGDGTVTIAGFSEEGKAVDWKGKTLIIPAELNGMSVARVEEYAFSMEYDWETGLFWNLQCDEVIFEGADTTIGEYAFWRSDMTAITLPKNLKYIELCTFYSCYDLVEINLPDSIKEISAHAFSECTSLTEIELPDSLEYIGVQAFSYTEITELTIPVGITGRILTTSDSYVEDKDISSIFFGMEKLEAIYVEAGNESYVSKNGVLYTADGTLLVFVPWAHPEVEEFEIPEGVQMIGSYAFEENENIKKLRIPASMGSESFVAYQLQTCPNLMEIEVDENNEHFLQIEGGLIYAGTDYHGDTYQSLEVILDTATSFTIPKEVTSLFVDIYNRSNLEELYVEEGSESFYAEDGVLFNYERTRLVTTIQKLSMEKYIVPDTIEIISRGAFHNCDNLISVEIGENVTEIGSNVLSDCENLVSVKIPANVTQIDSRFLDGSWNAVIYTPSGSYAESYAIENEIPYVTY